MPYRSVIISIACRNIAECYYRAGVPLINLGGEGRLSIIGSCRSRWNSSGSPRGLAHENQWLPSNRELAPSGQNNDIHQAPSERRRGLDTAIERHHYRVKRIDAPW